VALNRALTALVDNALRHAHSTVVVTADRRREQAVVAVSDDGPGVDPQLRPRLFDRFATGAPDLEQERRRYGLGLALVAEIAASHGGGVAASGPPGTTLRISLPAAPRSRSTSFQESSETASRRSPA